MFARLALNCNATMMPFYLISVTQFKPLPGLYTSPVIALVPLLTYTFSLLFTLFLQKKITQKFANRFVPMLISVFVTTAGCVPLIFLGRGVGQTPPVAPGQEKWIVLVCAPFTGIGLALMLNTGTSLISDVLGNDVKSAAFVYGAYSLLDKFANGFLLYFLVANYSLDPQALRWIISLIPIFCTVGTALVTWIGVKLYADKLTKISVGSMGKKKPKPQNESD